MHIQTKYHNEIEIEENQIIEFQNGIPGFIEEKKFLILPFAENTPYFIFQSAQTPDLAFVIADPFAFFAEYEFELPDSILQQLQIRDKEDVAIFAILTLQEPFEKTTANLRGPLIINHKKQIGKQVILNESNYTTKHLLLARKTPVGQEE